MGFRAVLGQVAPYRSSEQEVGERWEGGRAEHHPSASGRIVINKSTCMFPALLTAAYLIV